MTLHQSTIILFFIVNFFASAGFIVQNAAFDYLLWKMDNLSMFINDFKISKYCCDELDQFESYTRSVVFLSE
jgi:hypothetical protein